MPDQTVQPHDAEVCPQCLRPVRRGEKFCRECGAPVSIQAVTLVPEQIIAEGYIYREGCDHADEPIVFIGLWMLWGSKLLIFLCCDIVLLIAMPISMMDMRPIEWLIFVPLILMFGFWTWVFSVLLWRATKTYLQAARERKAQRVSSGDTE